MKKLALILLSLGLCAFANAQTVSTQDEDALKKAREESNKVVTNGFWDNWSITGAIGTQFYYGDNEKYMKFADQWTFPAIDLFFSKMVTPSFGFGLGISGITIKGVARDDNPIASFKTDKVYTQHDGTTYYRQKGHYVDPFLYFFLDLDNIFAGYNPNRFYNWALYAGGGLAIGFDHDLAGYNHTAPTFNAGFVNKFRLSDDWSLILNLRGALVGDSFDGESREGEPLDIDYIKKNIPVDGLFGITAGVCYRFGGKSRQLFAPAVNTEYYEDIIADKDLLVDNLNSKLQTSTDREVELAGLLAKMRAEKEAQKETHQLDFRWHINFDLDKWVLTNRELVDLELISEIMKMDPSITYYLYGYADKQTGSEKRNWKLSQERVNVVYKALTERYGVNPDQLKTQYDGGVDIMFMGDNKLTRCVMIYTQTQNPEQK